MQTNEWIQLLELDLTGSSLQEDFADIILLELDSRLQIEVEPKFLSYLKSNLDDIISCFNALAHALQFFISYVNDLLDCYANCSRNNANLKDQILSLIRNTIFTKNLDILQPYICSTLHLTFKHFDSQTNPDISFDLQNNDFENFLKLLNSSKFNYEFLFEKFFNESIRKYLSDKVECLCKSDFDKSCLEEIFEWTNIIYDKYLPFLFPNSSNTDALFQDELIYQLFYEYRKSQLFSIIIDFPDSEATILDLRTCLNNLSYMRSDIVKILSDEISRRLLHIGVNTSDILTGYICVVRALRLLDTSFVVQELVCKPIAAYLRGREDAIRCIIDKVIAEDGSSDLQRELCIPKPVDVGHSSDDEAYDEEEEFSWDTSTWKWQPDPVEAIYHRGLGRRHTDLLSMMVAIYGSQDMFLSEYRVLLAQRLLKKISFDTEREIRNLEMLKLRFGDQNLHECEVMLRDIHDSKRISGLVSESWGSQTTSDGNELFPITTYILSAQFWPPFKDETLKMSPKLTAVFEKYTSMYEKLKGNRTLRWLHQLGTVSIDLEIHGQKMTLDVTPMQVAMLDHFTRQKTWTMKDLANVIGVPVSTVRRLASFWLQHGVLMEKSSDCLMLCDKPPAVNTDPNGSFTMEEEVQSTVTSVKGQRDEELQFFWTYIVGMLTNLGSLSLDRIYSMLKMFAMSGAKSTECSLDQLKSFLDKKVKEGVLKCSDNNYKLNKS